MTSSPNGVDPTEPKRAEEALRESEAKFHDYAENASDLRLLVDTIPTLIWSAGPEGNIEYVSRRVLEYFGAPLGDIIGWGWMEKVHPDDVAFKVSTWLKNLESGNPHDAVCRMRGADGRYRWFDVRGEPLRASDGTVLSWYGVLIDIDDRRKAEEALRESEYKLRRIGWGSLCVWNDDEIAPNTGFPPHPHANMEIITYVREGAVTHKDSLGNEGRTEAGDVQVMSAGAGIRHAEYNLAAARCGLRAILPAGPVTRCDGQHSGLVRRWR